METAEAVTALSALAQTHRLAVFRLLVQEGPNGLAAGEVAERIGVPPSTLSHHLAQLEHAGLLRSWRVQRNIFYALDVEGTRRLVAFLTEDCCAGQPEICGYRPDILDCLPAAQHEGRQAPPARRDATVEPAGC